MEGRRYAAQNIAVRYEPRLCIHAAECVRGLPQVFDPARRPWIQAEKADAETIAEVVQRCPSGALQFERLDGGPGEPIPEGLELRLEANGPIYLRGALVVRNAAGDVLYAGNRAALCRCGSSRNKPFCDNSHLESGFQAEAGQLELPLAAEENLG